MYLKDKTVDEKKDFDVSFTHGYLQLNEEKNVTKTIDNSTTKPDAKIIVDEVTVKVTTVTSGGVVVISKSKL